MGTRGELEGKIQCDSDHVQEMDKGFAARVTTYVYERRGRRVGIAGERERESVGG